MSRYLLYVFRVNPGNAAYGDAWVVALLVLCGVLIVSSFLITRWRKRQPNAVTRKLSRSWANASFWFGFLGLVLLVSRVEGIQFFAMRFWAYLLVVFTVIYVLFQVFVFRKRHYEVLPMQRMESGMEKYLPHRKKK